MTAASGPETVREATELRLEVRLQDGTDNFLQQLVTPGRDAKRALFPVRLRDKHPPHGRPAIPLVTQSVDEPIDLRQRHPVDSFGCASSSQRTLVGIQACVGPQEELPIEQK